MSDVFLSSPIRTHVKFISIPFCLFCGQTLQTFDNGEIRNARLLNEAVNVCKHCKRHDPAFGLFRSSNQNRGCFCLYYCRYRYHNLS